MAYEMEFTPRICQPQSAKKGGKPTPAEYSGTIKMRLPSYKERQQLLNESDVVDEVVEEQVAAAVDGANIDEESIRKALGRKTVKKFNALLKRAADRLPEFVLAVNITRLEDGFVYTSFDDISHDGYLDGLVMEMTLKLVQKFRVGKPGPAS